MDKGVRKYKKYIISNYKKEEILKLGKEEFEFQNVQDPARLKWGGLEIFLAFGIFEISRDRPLKLRGDISQIHYFYLKLICDLLLYYYDQHLSLEELQQKLDINPKVITRPWLIYV